MAERCGCFDPVTFGHTMCDRRPPHAASEQAAQRRYWSGEDHRRWALVAQAVAMAAPRGAESAVPR